MEVIEKTRNCLHNRFLVRVYSFAKRQRNRLNLRSKIYHIQLGLRIEYQTFCHRRGNKHSCNLRVNTFWCHNFFSLDINIREPKCSLELWQYACISILTYECNAVDFFLFLKMSHYVLLRNIFTIVFHYDGRICLVHSVDCINNIVV